MRKKKQIRQVHTGGGLYYVYDLDMDAMGKVRRVYGRTEAEVKEKIEKAKEERQLALSFQKPNNTNLKEYVMFYFKNVVGQVRASKIKQQINLMDNAVFHSKMNRDILSITPDDVAGFYVKLSEKYSYQNLKDIADILQKTFELAAASGLAVADISEVPIPQKEVAKQIQSGYIMTGKELEQLRDFCIKENCVRYGRNEMLLLFCLFTGLRYQKVFGLRGCDVDLAKHTVAVNGIDFPLSEKCCQWLEQARQSQMLEIPSAEECAEGGVGITRYTNVLFTNAKGKSPSVTALQYTLSSILNQCGFPAGINSKTIHQAVILSELENGVSEQELARRYGYKSLTAIHTVRDAYIVQKTLF